MSVKKFYFENKRQVVFTDEVLRKLESRSQVFVRWYVGKRNSAKYCVKYNYNDRIPLMFWTNMYRFVLNKYLNS